MRFDMKWRKFSGICGDRPAVSVSAHGSFRRPGDRISPAHRGLGHQRCQLALVSVCVGGTRQKGGLSRAVRTGGIGHNSKAIHARMPAVHRSKLPPLSEFERMRNHQTNGARIVEPVIKIATHKPRRRYELNAGEVLNPCSMFWTQPSRLWSLSVSRAGLVVHDCDRVDIQRRFAAKNPASPRITVGIGVVIQPPGPQPTPIIYHEPDSGCDDHED